MISAMVIVMKHKKKLTPEQIESVERMSGVRIPTDMIATILNISRPTFERMCKTNAALRDALDRGRAKASMNVRGLAYQRCFDKTIPEATRQRAIEWWTMTQEGFRRTDQIEISGGSSIDMTDVEANAKLDKILSRLGKRK